MNWSDDIKRPRLVEDEVEEIELGPFAEKAMCLFGININILRSIPSVTDGLKLVNRRMLYMLYKEHKMNKVKTTIAIGDAQKIHPHSDIGMGDVYAGLAQTFSNNVPLLISHGNAGNMTSGNDAAAPRYLEISMSEFARDVLFKEFDGKVNMKASYDGTTQEPTSLPARFPLILLNGTMGIGYTMSTDIYPYNLNEIADATIKLLKNPKAPVHLVPDSPSGCDIIVKNENEFIMQSSFEIDTVNYQIIIKNTPYKKYLDDIDERIRQMQDSPDKIKEIIDINDESDMIENKLRYVIQCSPCNLYQLANKLFTKVPGFRISINSRNMTVIDPDLSMKKYDVRQILCSWIKNRLIEKRAWFLREIVRLNSERNMLKGKILMLSDENLEKTIQTFRSCDDDSQIVPALMKAYKGLITSSQANYMADVRMSQLTKKEHDNSLKKLEKIEAELETIKDIVYDADKIRNVIIDELKEIKAKYGFARRSKIITLGGEVNQSSVSVAQILTDGSILFSETENPDHLSSDITTFSDDEVLTIDEKGQFLWVDTTKVEHDKAMTLTSIGRSQMGKCIFIASSRDNNILLITNKGRIKYMPIDRIPSNSSKKPIMPQMANDEYVVSVLEIRTECDDILIYTSDGMGKRISIADLNRVVSVDSFGQYIFKEDVNVAGMFVINPNKPLMCYVTRLGKLRVNNTRYLTSAKKFSEAKRFINLSPQDDLIAVFCINENQELTLYHADSRISTVNIDSLGVSTLNTPAVKPKHVPAVKVIRAVVK